MAGQVGLTPRLIELNLNLKSVFAKSRFPALKRVSAMFLFSLNFLTLQHFLPRCAPNKDFSLEKYKYQESNSRQQSFFLLNPSILSLLHLPASAFFKIRTLVVFPPPVKVLIKDTLLVG